MFTFLCMRLDYAKYGILEGQKRGTLSWHNLLMGREVGTERIEENQEGYFLNIGWGKLK